MKIAVLTSLFGSKGGLRPLSKEENGYDVDYYAFVDRLHEKTEGWKQIVSPAFSCDQKYSHRRDAKPYKLSPSFFLNDYDVYLWIDSCWQIKVDPHRIRKEYLRDNDLAIFDHPHRNCAYDEAHVCLTQGGVGIDHPDLIANQIRFYESVRFPRNYGLYEMSCYMMRNNDITKKMGLMWLEQVFKFSSRDQVSFPYVLWSLKEKINISILPGYLHWKEHGNQFFLKVHEPELLQKY